jgi:hypothetical protein
MMIVFVNKDYLSLSAFKALCYFQPSESPSDNYDPRFAQVSDPRPRGY